MASGTYTVISPGSSSGSVNVGPGGVLAPWAVDASGNMVNTTNPTADLTKNGLALGAGLTGFKWINPTNGQARLVTADGTSNAVYTYVPQYVAQGVTGVPQFTDINSVSGIKIFYDGSNTPANTYTQVVRARAITASKSANYTVVVGDTGTIFDNSGATGTINFTIPSATIGQQYTFTTVTAQIVSVTPQAGDTIVLGAKAAGTAITSTAAKGGYLTLICTSANTWSIASVSATPSWS